MCALNMLAGAYYSALVISTIQKKKEELLLLSGYFKEVNIIWL